MKICWKHWLLGVATSLLLRPCVASQQPLLYTQWENFTVANGMPSDSVFSVATDGGRVWAGTSNGLALIENGRVVRILSPRDGLANQVVTSIAVDGITGDLWIATFGGLSRYSGGQFQNFTSLATGLANDIVFDVAVQNEYVWAATAMGISRLNTHTGEWSLFDESNTPMRNSLVTRIAENKQTMFFATWGGGVVEYDSVMGRWSVYDRLRYQSDSKAGSVQSSDNAFITGLAVDGYGQTLWASTYFSYGYSARLGRIQQSLFRPPPAGFINKIRINNNDLWICTSDGLGYMSLPNGASLTSRRNGTGGQGELIFSAQSNQGKVYTFTALAGHQVYDLAFYSGDIWVATGSGLSHGTRNASRLKATQAQTEGAAPMISRTEPDNIVAHDSEKPDSKTVNIGFFGPLENSADTPYGLAMLHGAQLAIDEANADGGYRGRQYALKVHSDSGLWGASTTEPVRMITDEHVVAVLGAIDGVSSQILLRIAGQLEVPVVNTGTTDSTITKTGIPWILHPLPDDQQQAHVLADYVFNQLKLRRVVVLCVDDGYGNDGAKSFVEAARIVGHEPSLVVSFKRGANELAGQLQQVRDAAADGVVIWSNPIEAAAVLKAMRASGMSQQVVGSDRLASPLFLEKAGRAAEGVVVTSELSPSETDPKWRRFQNAYRRAFNDAPDSYACHAYDGMNMIIESIEKVGPDRKQVMNALREYGFKDYQGVSGLFHFGHALNNIAPLALARVEGGRFVQWAVVRP